MATETTTVTPDQLPFPLAGAPPGGSTPYQLIQLVANGFTAAASGAGDNQRVLISSLLPRGNAYALLDYYVELHVSGAGNNNWGASAGLFMRNAIAGAGGLTIVQPIECVSDNVLVRGAGPVEQRDYRAPRLPTGILFPSQVGVDNQIQVEFDIYNTTANDIETNGHMYALLAQWPIEQAYYFAIHTPMLVRGAG